jgi:hypothetical protein
MTRAGVIHMETVNRTRFALGGLASAVIIFVISGGVNGAILGDEWSAWVNAMGRLNHAPSNGVGATLWLLVSAIYGGGSVWLYASIRPRFGKGPRTALLAGLAIWLLGWVASSLGQVALGGLPRHALAVSCVGGLAAALLGTLAGAAIYTEAESPDAARERAVG